MASIIKLMQSCFLVKGHSRALIVDTQRKKYHAVPNALVDFIEKSEGQDMEHSIATYAEGDEDNVTVLREYIDFLLTNEIIFFCGSAEEYDRFPPISTQWQYPAHITNAVIEVQDIEDIKRFNNFQKAFFIPYVQFIIRGPIPDISIMEQYIALMTLRYVKGIQVLFNNSAGFTEDELAALCNKYPLIENLFAYNSKYNNTLKSLKTFLVFTTQKDFSNTCCGVVDTKYFNPMLQHYTEALQYNTCLNRKLAVDVNGYIRNCLSMTIAYGNVAETAIDDVVFSSSFQKYWGLKKDDIAVCRDCEFRYICTDCRAYTDNPADIHSKPLKCGYNPYTNEWGEWSSNPIKQSAIEYYNIKPVTKTLVR